MTLKYNEIRASPKWISKRLRSWTSIKLRSFNVIYKRKNRTLIITKTKNQRKNRTPTKVDDPRARAASLVVVGGQRQPAEHDNITTAGRVCIHKAEQA